MNYLLLTISILPVLIIGLYIYKKDKNKEPNSLLIKLFILGFISVIIVGAISLLIYYIFPNLAKDTTSMNTLEIIIYTFIVIAATEELCKWIIVYMFGYKSRENDEVYDLIVYAVFVSLGFACIENIMYITLNPSISVGILRAIFAIPAHTSFAITMGYYLSKARIYQLQTNDKLRRKNIIFSVIVPILLHGIYDFCLLSNYNILIVVFFVFVIVLYKASLKKLKELSTAINYNRNNLCPNCNSQLVGKHCYNCGIKQKGRGEI